MTLKTYQIDTHNQYFKRQVKNSIGFITLLLLSILGLFPILHILFQILEKGISPLLNISLSFQNPIIQALCGSIELLCLASIVSIPLSLSLGIYLSEFKNNPLSRVLNIGIENLASIPPIIVGILIYVNLVLPFKSFSGLAGAIALSFLICPPLIIEIKTQLQAIPKEHSEAGYALGAPFYRVVHSVKLPLIKPHLYASIISTLSKVSAETIPLLFTTFGNQYFTLNPLDPLPALPLLIFEKILSPDPENQGIAWASSLVLCTLIVITNISFKSRKTYD